MSLGKLAAFLCIVAGAAACVWAGRMADMFGKARIAALALVMSGSAAVLPDSPQFSAIVADNAPPDLAGSLVTFQASLGFLLTVFTVQLAPIVAANWGWPVLLAALAAGPTAGLVGMRIFLGR